MARFATVLFVLVASSASAFTVTAPFKTHNCVQTNLQLMAAEELETLMAKATGCADSECSVDEVADFVELLKVQQKELSDRVTQVNSMIKSLEIINGQDDRKVDQVRETVRAIFRVFQLGDKGSGNNYPSLSKPTGWSGDVGSGPTTAYDSLPPKRWKPKP